MLLEVCLDTNWYAVLRVARAEDCPVEDIEVFEDCLTFGDIADLSAEARMDQLGRWGIPVADGFQEHQQRFYGCVPQACTVRVWTGRLPHQVIALSLVCALAQPCASVVCVRGAVEEWLLDNRRLPERFEAFARDASPIDGADRERQVMIWEQLVQEDAELRIAPGGQPCSAKVDVFDNIIRQELARGGYRDPERRAYEIACACMEAAGGLLAPEFFAWRIHDKKGPGSNLSRQV